MRVAFVVVALLLAGCGSSEELTRADPPAATNPLPPTARADAPGSAPSEGSRWELIRVGDGGAIEASVATSADAGTLLVCTHGLFEGPSPTWISQDAGVSWARIGPDLPIDGGDCDVVVLPSGRIVIVYATELAGCIVVSSDDTRTWDVARVGAAPLYPGPCDRPWLALDGNDVLLTHKSINSIPLVLVFQRSSDGGRTWTSTVAARGEEGPRLAGGVGPMLVDGARILIPLHRFDGGTPAALGTPDDHVLDVVVSEDSGATWASQRVRGPFRSPASLPILARLPEGELALSFRETGKDRQFVDHVLVSADGATWAIARSDPFPFEARRTFAWPATRSTGEPYVAWQEWREDDGWTLQLAPFHGEAASITEPAGEADLKVEFAMPRGDLIAYVEPGDGCRGLCVMLARAIR